MIEPLLCGVHTTPPPSLPLSPPFPFPPPFTPGEVLGQVSSGQVKSGVRKWRPSVRLITFLSETFLSDSYAVVAGPAGFDGPILIYLLLSCWLGTGLSPLLFVVCPSPLLPVGDLLVRSFYGRRGLTHRFSLPLSHLLSIGILLLPWGFFFLLIVCLSTPTSLAGTCRVNPV